MAASESTDAADPLSPVFPRGPSGPLCPCSPRGPCAPAGPAGPGGPARPRNPRGPRRPSIAEALDFFHTVLKPYSRYGSMPTIFRPWPELGSPDALLDQARKLIELDLDLGGAPQLHGQLLAKVMKQIGVDDRENFGAVHRWASRSRLAGLASLASLTRATGFTRSTCPTPGASRCAGGFRHRRKFTVNDDARCITL